MTLYDYVASKKDLLEGMADLVADEIELPLGDVDWRKVSRRWAASAHEALAR